uniref:Uncharacterized protein n=1 Tax=Janibacter limosus TaxID=53458 RepID=A0AC61U7K9_9MICO|nr:hypothetical protein [Janibacter limosus]
MRAHLVVGGGDQSSAVTAELAAALRPRHPIARPSLLDFPVDPVVLAIETHPDRVLAALDLPAPVVADLIATILPRDLPQLLRPAREIDPGPPVRSRAGRRRRRRGRSAARRPAARRSRLRRLRPRRRPVGGPRRPGGHRRAAHARPAAPRRPA